MEFEKCYEKENIMRILNNDKRKHNESGKKPALRLEHIMGMENTKKV